MTHFKVKLGTAGIGIAHFGNGLTTFHSLTFVNQKALVMTVCTQESRTMLDNNQITVTAQSGTGIYHFTIGRSYDRLPRITGNIHTFVGTAEFSDDVARSRPLPSNAAGVAHTARRYGRRCRRGCNLGCVCLRGRRYIRCGR